jgi:hypothetical protein
MKNYGYSQEIDAFEHVFSNDSCDVYTAQISRRRLKNHAWLIATLPCLKAAGNGSYVSIVCWTMDTCVCITPVKEIKISIIVLFLYYYDYDYYYYYYCKTICKVHQIIVTIPWSQTHNSACHPYGVSK